MSDNVVGQLKVLLTAELGGFVSDMGKAAHVAEQSAKDISREFASLQRVASQTFGAFGSFNPIISQMSFVLSTAGRAAADAMGVFSKLGAEMANSSKLAALFGTGLGTLAEFSVGAAVAMGAAGLSAIALANQTAESVAKTYELAQATGVNVEALSALSFAAKQAGVDQETLARGLERMSKSAFAAATAPAGAINAYTRLGVSVKDAAGNIRPTEDLLVDLSSKFASMPDGILKTAEALNIFGKGGASLISFLDQGPSKIKASVEMAHALGTAFGEDVGKAAENFRSQLGLLGEAGEGLKIRLMQDLLPALQNVLSYMETDFAKGPNSSIRALIDDVAALSKQVLAAGADFILLARTAEGFWKGTPMGQWGGPTLHKMTDQQYAAKLDDDKKGDAWDRAWKEHDDFLAALNAPAPVPEHDMRPPGFGIPKTAAAVAYGAGEKDIVAEMVEKLQAQAAAEMQLAGATNLSTAAMLLQKSAGEADRAVADKRTELLAREKQLQEQLAGARANAATNTAAGEEAARLEKQIGDVRRMLGELEKDTPRIKQLYAEIVTATEVTRIGEEFNKEGLGFDRKISGLIDLSVAYRQGSTSVANANIDKDLEEDKQKIAEVQELLANASPFSAKGPGPSGQKFELEQELKSLTEEMETHRSQLKQITALDISVEIAREQRAFIDEAAAVQGLSSAYLESAAAVREFEVNRKVAQFGIEHPGSSTQQINDVRKLYREQSEQEFTLSISQQAPQFELGRGAADAIERLQAVKEELEKAGKTTILIDFAIDKAGADDAISKAKQLFEVENSRLVIDASIYDAQRAQIEQFDQLSNKVGTLGDRFRAMANDIALEGQNLGEKIFNSFNKAIDGIEDQMAKLIVTGRSDFRKMFEGIEENLIKSGLQAAFGELTNVAGFGVQKDKETEGPLKPAGALLASLPISPNGPAPTDGTDSKSTAGGFLAGLQKMALGAIGIKTPDARAAAEKTKPLGTRGDPIFVSFTQTNSAAVNAPQRPAGFELPAAAAPASVGLPQLGAQGTATTPPIFSPLPSATGTPDSGNTAGAALQEAGSIARLAGSTVPGPGGQTLRSVTSTISPVISLVKLLEQHSATTTALQPGGNILDSLPIPKNPLPDLSAISSTLPSDTGTGSSESAAAAAKSIQGVPEVGQDNSAGPQLYGPNGPSTASTAIGLAGAGLNLASSITKFLELLNPKAAGGPVTPGRSFLVGEKGPEIFSPNTAGTIIPNHVFAGFRAEGGDVAPGKSYMVGEQGFEVFQEDSGRTAVPSSIFETNSSSSTSSRSRSSRTQHTVVNQNFPNVKDADNFRRSKGQVLAEFHAQASIANKRNG